MIQSLFLHAELTVTALSKSSKFIFKIPTMPSKVISHGLVNHDSNHYRLGYITAVRSSGREVLYVLNTKKTVKYLSNLSLNIILLMPYLRIVLRKPNSNTIIISASV